MASRKPTTENIMHYKQARAATKKVILQAHNSYVNELLGNVKTDPTPFYKYIRSKRTERAGISSLTSGGTVITDDRVKATAFGVQFFSVFTKEKTDYIPYRCTQNKVAPVITVNQDGVLKLLLNLQDKKAKGPDGIAPRILRENAKELAPCLMFLYNQFLRRGEVPDDWRAANITPIFKKGRKDPDENYRPVSLTSIARKVLEPIVYSNICRHLNSGNIITPRQHGFRTGHSCESQLIIAVEDWAKAVDLGNQVDVAIFDFCNAFDTVPHERLKSKLRTYGISGNTLKWI